MESTMKDNLVTAIHQQYISEHKLGKVVGLMRTVAVYFA